MSAGAIAIDGGGLPLGGGLLALVRPALLAMAPGGVLALRSSSPGVRQDLPSWCRVERHEYLGCEPDPDGRWSASGTMTVRHPLEVSSFTTFSPRSRRWNT